MFSWLTDSEENISNKELKKAAYKRGVVKHLYNKGIRANSFLAKKLNVSIPTIQTILNELIEEDVVKERGLGESNGGRRPNLYGLSDHSFYTMGIDIGRQATRISIYNHKNESVSGIEEREITLINEMTFVDEVFDFSQEVVKKSGIDQNKLIAVGITMPGLIDTVKGINHTHLNFGRPIRDIFKDRFDSKVYLENDARARALAELKFGGAVDKKNVLVLHVDSGLGMGMIFDGKIYQGASGYAGEFSHIPMVSNGVLCNCGKYGCLETIASGMSLVRKVEEGLKAGNESILLHKENNGSFKFQIEEIIDAVLQGDLFCINLITELAQNLGKGIGSLIQILNPELIIVGGRLSKANEYLTTPISQSLFMYCLPKLREDVNVAISQLDKEAGVLGAVAAATNNIFQ